MRRLWLGIGLLLLPSCRGLHCHGPMYERHTLLEMRQLVTATLAWATDQVGPGGVPEPTAGLPPRRDCEALLDELLKHEATVTCRDAWGHALELYVDPTLATTPFVVVRSPGRDGVFDEPIPASPEGWKEWKKPRLHPGDEQDRDIVFADFRVIRGPDIGAVRRQLAGGSGPDDGDR